MRVSDSENFQFQEMSLPLSRNSEFPTTIEKSTSSKSAVSPLPRPKRQPAKISLPENNIFPKHHGEYVESPLFSPLNISGQNQSPESIRNSQGDNAYFALRARRDNNPKDSDGDTIMSDATSQNFISGDVEMKDVF